jgi:hypothetical protein
MKPLLKWSLITVGAIAGGTFVVRGVQGARRRLKSGLAHMEAVTDQARATLEQTESALRDARTSL